jgi:lipopolysaccharide/colanic/teichoic acid biosynthesis glycosyltransferase
MTPADRNAREAKRLKRKRADPAYRAAENARRSPSRALIGRTIRVTFSDALPQLVAVMWRDLAAQPLTSTRND